MQARKKILPIEIQEQLRRDIQQFMEEYERRQLEIEFKKQRIKQNVMMDILSNKQKYYSSTASAKNTEKFNKFQQIPSIQSLKKSQGRLVDGKILTDRQSRQTKPSQKPQKEETFSKSMMRSNSLPNEQISLPIHNQNKFQINESNSIMKQPQYITFKAQHQEQVEQIEENQSDYLISQNNNKNFAFDIVIDKSDPNQNLQELKRKKIIELEKKRQQRLQQNKKVEEDKKDHSRGKYSNYGRKTIGKNSASNILNTSEQYQDSSIKGQNKGYKRPIKSNNYSVHDFHQEDKNNKKSQQKNSSFGLSNVTHTDKAIPSSQKVSERTTLYEKNDRNDRYQRLKDQKFNLPLTPKTIQGRKQANQRPPFMAQSPNRQKSSTKPQKKPSTKQSNRKLMIGAITYVCLPGELNRKQRQKLLQVLQNQPLEWFIFLFKEYSRKVIKGIYVLDPINDKVRKIYGDKAPNELYPEQVHQFYRYDTGCRQFKKLDGCKSFSFAVFAVDLK